MGLNEEFSTWYPHRLALVSAVGANVGVASRFAAVCLQHVCQGGTAVIGT